MAFTMRHSIHGRRLGLTSSGGVITSPSGSTAIGQAAQMWGDDEEVFETVSSGGATISNSGVTVVSTDSTSGMAALVVSAPVTGLLKEIHFQTSATALTLETSASTIKFNSTLAESAAGGSTTLTVTGAAGGIAGVVVLRGLSNTAWSIVSHTANVSS